MLLSQVIAPITRPLPQSLVINVNSTLRQTASLKPVRTLAQDSRNVSRVCASWNKITVSDDRIFWNHLCSLTGHLTPVQSWASINVLRTNREAVQGSVSAHACVSVCLIHLRLSAGAMQDIYLVEIPEIGEVCGLRQQSLLIPPGFITQVVCVLRKLNLL